MVNAFQLSNDFYEFSFGNPEKIKPIHGSLYHYIIHHNNKLGWVEKFGLPTGMTMAAIGVKNVNTYTNGLNDLIEWGFINMVQKKKNQYTANIIALVKNREAHLEALSKALCRHTDQHSVGTVSINKPLNYKTTKQGNSPDFNFEKLNFSFLVEKYFLEHQVILNNNSRRAISEMEDFVKVKTRSKDPTENSNHFISLWGKLKSDKWWKDKRNDLTYLAAKFEEAYQVAFTSKSKNLKIDYSRHKKTSNG